MAQGGIAQHTSRRPSATAFAVSHHRARVAMAFPRRLRRFSAGEQVEPAACMPAGSSSRCLRDAACFLHRARAMRCAPSSRIPPVLLLAVYVAIMYMLLSCRSAGIGMAARRAGARRPFLPRRRRGRRACHLDGARAGDIGRASYLEGGGGGRKRRARRRRRRRKRAGIFAQARRHPPRRRWPPIAVFIQVSSHGNMPRSATAAPARASYILEEERRRRQQ